ncbi:unnamed protein product [Meloidogyne enterolobii]|uniref:Uncharacterized protein n=1 Tax=Meloidogyne enterolobii TaxID=390850 RepID=A0ACB0YUL1_MELEN
MVKDRLQELHKARPSLRSPAELSVSGLTNNLQLGNNDYFLQQIAKMNSCLDEIDCLIKQMLQVQQTILCRTIAEPQDKQQLDFIINQFRKLVGELRTNLQKLEFEQQQEKSLNLTSNATQRINLNQVEQLKRRFCQILETFQKSREDYRQRVTKRVKRQLELAGEPLNQEDVEHLLEEKSEQIFYRNINPMNVAAHLALEEASDRHNELVKLEKSIGELNECFGDMLALVHSQGTIVDRVDKNVQSALEYTNQARKQMNKAVTYKKSSNRLKCAIVLLLGGIVLILILLLLISFKLFLPNLTTH